MIRTLLVDDERPARERLRRLLAAFPNIEVVGEAEDGESGLEMSATLRPDLLLLDVQMPGVDGLAVAASLPEPRPRIIFCTAHDRYAVDAFELKAADYLLKPVSRARLQQAIERLGTTEASPLPPARRFLAKRANRWVVVPQEDVVCFVSEEGLTNVRAAGHEYWLDPTLNDLEARLDSQQFHRVSRSAIVNLAAVREAVTLTGGMGEILLSDGVRVEVSRRRLPELLEKLGKI
jgi:two-component system LytT family response regulator